MSPASSSTGPELPAAKRVEFDDPHAGVGGLQEAEVTRVRTLRGVWRWALILATALTILTRAAAVLRLPRPHWQYMGLFQRVARAIG